CFSPSVGTTVSESGALDWLQPIRAHTSRRIVNDFDIRPGKVPGRAIYIDRYNNSTAEFSDFVRRHFFAAKMLVWCVPGLTCTTFTFMNNPTRAQEKYGSTQTRPDPQPRRPSSQPLPATARGVQAQRPADDLQQTTWRKPQSH